MDDLDSHALNVGKIVGNLLSLELFLRAAIATADKNMNFTWPFQNLKVGDMIKSDPITNYESLGPTIDKFNSLVSPADRLDRSQLVGLRDILAHGRISSSEPQLPLSLVKFGREKDGMVQVEAVINMSQRWFDEHRELTFKAIEKVSRIMERLRSTRPAQ